MKETVKLFEVYREVFPTPQDLVEHLKYDDDYGECLAIGTDYNCFIDFYEKWGDDINDDELNEFDSKILLLMKKDLEELNYKVEIKDDYLTASIKD